MTLREDREIGQGKEKRRVRLEGHNVPSSQTRQTDAQSCSELDEGGVERQLLLQTVGDEDGDDEPVNTDDTGHDDRDDVCSF